MSRKRKTKIQTEPIRPVINARAAGVDIGSREIYAAVSPELEAATPVRCYETFTQELKKLVEWFANLGITTVAMEATSVYWIPETAENLRGKRGGFGETALPCGYSFFKNALVSFRWMKWLKKRRRVRRRVRRHASALGTPIS